MKSMTDNIKVEGHKGTWYIIGTHTIIGKTYHILEHETYGDLADLIVVDENYKEVDDYDIKEKLIW